MKKVLIITDSLEGEKTGIGYVSLGLLNKLKEVVPEKIIEFDRTKTPLFNILVWPLKKIFKFELVRIWFNLLPFILRNTNVEYILNLSTHPHYIPFKQKEIILVHDIIPITFPQYLKHKYFSFSRLFFERSIRNARKIVTVSKYSKQEIINQFKINPKKIFTLFVPYFQSKKYFAEKKPIIIGMYKYILNLNTIEPRKNIIGLIKAYELLRNNHSVNYKLVIAGKLGWKYLSILSTIKKSKYVDDIILTGYVSDEEKKYLFTHASVFVFVPFVEGFGLPVFEALVYGCPSVVSNTPCLPEVAGKAVSYVNPHNTQEIASAIYRIIIDNKYRSKLVRLSKKRAMYYTKTSLINRKIRQLLSFLSL